jgi:SAM-dependent methyltransferase
MYSCRICDHPSLERLGVESLLFPAASYAPGFHEYTNHICPNCGVVSCQPEPTDDALVEYYNNAYRKSRDAIQVGGTLLDMPIDMTVSGRSLARVKNFHAMLERNAAAHPDIWPGAGDTVLDYGAYQGAFLHGVSQLWPCRCIASDYSESGIRFARDFLGFRDSVVTDDMYSPPVNQPMRFVTMLHVLEHLREPVRFLRQLAEDVLQPGGYLYIEVPNLYGTALCDPVHFFTYSPESLQYLLNQAGYKIVDSFVSGFPETSEFAARNPEQNIICLATVDPDLPAESIHRSDPTDVRRRLAQAYRRHSMRATIGQARTAVRELLRFGYYLGFTQVLERVSSRLSMTLLRSLGRRR